MRAADLERGRDDGPVTEVYAIEIAHRHNRAPGDRIDGRGVADNGKGRHRLRDHPVIFQCPGSNIRITSRRVSFADVRTTGTLASS